MANGLEHTTPTIRHPDRSTLREAALAHLARFGTTQHGLEQVLTRYIARWARKRSREGVGQDAIDSAISDSQALIRDIVSDMTRLGAVDDSAFSRSRAASLTRTGRSRRAIHAHLAQRGVDEITREEAIAESLGERGDENAHNSELGAALVLTRKRKLGPFRASVDEQPDANNTSEDHHKALMTLARAGFSREIAEEALNSDFESAVERIMRLKSS